VLNRETQRAGSAAKRAGSSEIAGETRGNGGRGDRRLSIELISSGMLIPWVGRSRTRVAGVRGSWAKSEGTDAAVEMCEKVWKESA
jgi:hypothetical protein